MAISPQRAVLIIAICAACTFAERALPFVVFRGREMPDAVKYLGKVLPMAIIATLIIYCVRNSDFLSTACLPQLIAAAVTAGLHLWRRSTLLSILGGTVCCMLLTQFIF